MFDVHSVRYDKGGEKGLSLLLFFQKVERQKGKRQKMSTFKNQMRVKRKISDPASQLF